jgi:maltokinase
MSTTTAASTTNALPSRLDAALADWMPWQRWFSAKGRPIRDVGVVHHAPFVDRRAEGGPAGYVLTVRVRFGDGGGPEFFHVPIGLRSTLPRALEPSVIAAVDGSVVYDALGDPALVVRIMELIDGGAHCDDLSFHRETGAADPSLADTVQDAEAGTTTSTRGLGVEQTNSSVVIGERFLLKVYRRLTIGGVNPELELQRALTVAGAGSIPPLLGAIEGRREERPVTYGVLQRFLSDAADGWGMALASVRDLLAGDQHAGTAGGDFAAEAHRLGGVVAETHALLADGLGTVAASAADLARLAAGMTAHLDTAIAAVPALAELAPALREAFSFAADGPAALAAPAGQRVHGDLHLGQTLRTPAGWLLVDFEGEPAAPLAERRSPHSPLRDIAGMLRSFDYAAHHQFHEPSQPVGSATGAREQAREWAQRNQSAFCEGYAAVAGTDPREHAALLHAHLVHKAVYEAVYEARHRPGWLAIPLEALREIAGRARPGAAIPAAPGAPAPPATPRE